MDTALIRVENLTKHFTIGRGLMMRPFGEVKAVDGISFDLRKGETFAIVGESGCGKTTTSRMVLRLMAPTGGSIRQEDGLEVDKLTGADLVRYRSEVQAVFQDPWSSLNPRMRVREIVSEALVANRKVTRAEVDDRVAVVMNQVGLNPAMATRFPHEFSGGQRQRVAIAAALASQPNLIVLDEPVSALDVSVRAQVMNLLKDLQGQEGVAYMLIAHNLATVRYMAHETAVMYLGQIVEHAETEELFRNTLHPYSKALVSASLAAHPDSQQDDMVLMGETPSPINKPSGCPFHTRCPFVMDRCKSEVPEFKAVAPRHKVACHLY